VFVYLEQGREIEAKRYRGPLGLSNYEVFPAGVFYVRGIRDHQYLCVLHANRGAFISDAYTA
jgi:uncharacterized protein YigE (DUF2233 family)